MMTKVQLWELMRLLLPTVRAGYAGHQRAAEQWLNPRNRNNPKLRNPRLAWMTEDLARQMVKHGEWFEKAYAEFEQWDHPWNYPVTDWMTCGVWLAQHAVQQEGAFKHLPIRFVDRAGNIQTDNAKIGMKRALDAYLNWSNIEDGTPTCVSTTGIRKKRTN